MNNKSLNTPVKRLLESNEYTNEDYLEVFFKFFRPWIKKLHGDEISEYPFSYLLEKYFNDFVQDLGLGDRRGYYGISTTNLVRAGQEIVSKGLTKLPSLRAKENFLEKYKKPLESIIELLNIPEYMKLNLTETSPYEVTAIFDVDFPTMIKSENTPKRANEYIGQFKKFLENFMNIEFGRATHGRLNLKAPGEASLNGVDDWVKEVLNKDIKKDIKKLPESKVLHSIRFEPHVTNPTLKLIFKSWGASWDQQRELKAKVKELLKNKGYNTDILGVDT